jgi:hypothetical protein
VLVGAMDQLRLLMAAGIQRRISQKHYAFEIIIMVLLKIQVFADVPHYQLVNSYRSFEGSRSHLLGLFKRNLVILIKLCAFLTCICLRSHLFRMTLEIQRAAPYHT